MSQVLLPRPDTYARAAAAIASGQLVGLPTETVYGLAGDGLNPEAIARIYATKERPRFNPLILHIPPWDLEELAGRELIAPTRLSPRARATIARLMTAWPTSLTLILPRGAAVPDLTTAGLDTVALRAPDHPVAQRLIAMTGPLAAPSANRSGRVSPTRAKDVVDDLGDGVDCVLDGGACTVGVESSVVHVQSDGHIVILRAGAWDPKRLQALGQAPAAHGDDLPEAPRSPGTGSRHYAPQTPFFALPSPIGQVDLRDWLGARTAAVLCWDAQHVAAARKAHPDIHALALDADGDPARTARALYAGLRHLDQLDVDVLLVEPFPPRSLGQTGLLHALGDRMARATRPWVP